MRGISGHFGNEVARQAANDEKNGQCCQSGCMLSVLGEGQRWLMALRGMVFVGLEHIYRCHQFLGIGCCILNDLIYPGDGVIDLIDSYCLLIGRLAHFMDQDT